MSANVVANEPNLENSDVRSGLALPASGGGLRVALVLHHTDDSVVACAREVWAELSQASQLWPFLCVEYSPPTGDDPAPPDLGRLTRQLEHGVWETVGLMYTLHGLGALARVDIVTVCTTLLDDTQQAQLSEADDMLRRDLRRIVPDATPVSSHRVWVPHYDDAVLAPRAALASSEATSALVVLPVDREFEGAAAMPVVVPAANPESGGVPDDEQGGEQKDNSRYRFRRSTALPVDGGEPDDVYAWHLAVEVASLAGLWLTMHGAPLEFIERADSGIGATLVRLMRSMCRVVRIHMPSPERSLDGTGSLPLTPGKLPAPDPAYSVRAAAPHIYPPEFRELDNLRSLVPLLESVKDRRESTQLNSSPAIFAASEDTVEAASRLDDYVNRTAAIARWTLPLAGDAAASVGNPSKAYSEALTLLERTDTPLSIEEVPVRGWDELLNGVFGIVDGTPTTDEVQKTVASERYAVVNPTILAPDENSLVGAIAALDRQEREPDDDDASNSSSAVRRETEDVDELNEVSTTSSGTLGSDSSAVIGKAVSQPSLRLGDETSLLAEVTNEFNSKIERSERDVKIKLRQLWATMSRDGRPEPGVTSFVSYAVVAAALIGAGSLLTLTPVRDVLTPDELPQDLRIRLFLLFALVTTFPPVLRLMPGRNWSAQVLITTLAAVYAGAVAAVVVLAPTIEASWLDQPGMWAPAAVVVLVVLVLAIAARLHEPSGDRELLGPLSVLVGDRMAAVVPIAYAFVIAVAGLNFNARAPAIFDDPDWRLRLLIILLSVAVAVATVASLLRRVIRRRDRRQVREWQQQIDELVEGCELGAARTAALEVLKAHWLTTAAVLARLIHRPFGSHYGVAAPRDPAPSVRKLLMFDVDLTDETRDALLGELLPALASSGWLLEQHRRMSEQFVNSERSRLGIGADRSMPPPEHCTYPLSLQSVMRGEGNGPRWHFAQSVYSGDFDSLLHETALSALNRALAATLLSPQLTVSLGSARDSRQTLPQLLGELLPAGEARLPSGTLPPSTESPPEYQSRVWWPETVALPDGKPPTEHHCRDLREHGTVLLQAIRVDLSEPVGIERLTPANEPEALSLVGSGDLVQSTQCEAQAEPLM